MILKSNLTLPKTKHKFLWLFLFSISNAVFLVLSIFSKKESWAYSFLFNEIGATQDHIFHGKVIHRDISLGNVLQIVFNCYSPRHKQREKNKWQNSKTNLATFFFVHITKTKGAATSFKSFIWINMYNYVYLWALSVTWYSGEI